MMLCARHQNLTYLVIAVALACLGAFLPAPYFAPYHALAYTVFALTLAVAYRPRFSWSEDLSFWAWTSTTIVLFAMVGYLALTSLQHLQFFGPGREADLRSTLHDYLSYGGTVGMIKSLEPFIGVPLSGPNPLFFLTAIGVAFPLYAVWVGWSRDVAALVFVFWLFLLFT